MKKIFLRIKLFILAITIFTSFNSHALVGVGGYVPFGFSTQKKAEGGTTPFEFQPLIALNAALKITGSHYFMPELGYVKHGSLKDKYTKETFYILYDGGYLLGNRFMARYGIGAFITRIGGKGETIVQRNGSTGTSNHYAPDTKITSHNTTLDFGAEYGFSKSFAFRVETYVFSFLSSEKRDISYSVSLNYYL